MDKNYTHLEFDKIIEMLCAHAITPRAQEKLAQLRPFENAGRARAGMLATEHARAILDAGEEPPIDSMREFGALMPLIALNHVLTPAQLTCVAMFLTACRRLKLFLARHAQNYPDIAAYGMSIDTLGDIEDEISRCIRGEQVDDRAAPELRDARRAVEAARQKIKQRLETLLRSHPQWFAQGYIAMRSNKATLPVKREYKKFVNGSVIDISASGATLFVEPASVRAAQEELAIAQIIEQNQVQAVLSMLSAMLNAAYGSLRVNCQCMEEVDHLFARAKFSQQIGGRAAELSDEREIVIKNARHPLIKEDPVPLNFNIGRGYTAVIITGPNTGGKTVALKTVGLLQVMAQSGLHVPADEGTRFPTISKVLCDLGDGQSIEQNLSTFSSHITAIRDILPQAGYDTLVLLDELGSGTDPAEGMGLAVALLEEFKRKGCLLLATTHYPQIKDFALNTPGFINARMTFDPATLRPLYRMVIGAAGESCALQIASRLGLPQHVIKRAAIAAYGEDAVAYPISGDKNISDAENGGAPVQETDQPALIKHAQPPRPAIRAIVKTQFSIGDLVYVPTVKHTGIIAGEVNSRGEITVQVRGKKIKINHKRLEKRIDASELYPEDYDMSIVLSNVQDRKTQNKMRKRHDPDNMIVIREGTRESE